jgi:hypothetical protein
MGVGGGLCARMQPKFSEAGGAAEKMHKKDPNFLNERTRRAHRQTIKWPGVDPKNHTTFVLTHMI